MKNLLKSLEVDERYTVLLNLLNKYGSIGYFSNKVSKNIIFPPVVIPILDMTSSCLDKQVIIKHWFVEREINYTYVYGENFKNYSEEARTFETFLTKFFLDWLIIEEEITIEMKIFSKQLEFNELEAIYTFFDKYGDNPNEITRLKYFTKSSGNNLNITPIEYVNNISSYTGDFSTSVKGLININGIEKATSFEIQDSTKRVVNKLSNLPLWLKNNANQKYLFDMYIEKNELDNAWLALNSSGWKLTDVEVCLEVLTQKNNKNGFDDMVENWMSNWKDSSCFKTILVICTLGVKR